MNKTLISAALATAGIIAAPSANAALAADAVLLMGDQSYGCNYDLGTPPDGCLAGTYPDGNYFAMDTAGDGIDTGDRTAIEVGTAGGITLGATTLSGEIDAPWVFFGPTGTHKVDSAITIVGDDGSVDGTVDLDFSGWRVFWNNTNINMGGSTTTTPSWPDTGLATITCGSDCSVGDTYSLDYAAHVPDDGATDFGNVSYAFHIEGTIGTSEIPVPAAVWLFGSGLLGLVGVARRRKAA